VRGERDGGKQGDRGVKRKLALLSSRISSRETEG
jgi:hypothetical protein